MTDQLLILLEVFPYISPRPMQRLIATMLLVYHLCSEKVSRQLYHRQASHTGTGFK